ncbi:hypothetical protein quinque_004735 [Culex quinquefasciatus]
MEFNCDAQIRKLLEPMVADFGKHDAFGVRSWNPLLVEACTGAAERDDLGPVGLEKNPTLVYCSHQTPSPNCSYRVNIPIGYNSFFVSLGNKTTPYTTCCLFTAALGDPVQSGKFRNHQLCGQKRLLAAQLFQFQSTQPIISPQCECPFKRPGAQNVLQPGSFTVTKSIASQLEPDSSRISVEDRSKSGVRNWKLSLLVESCFG